MKINHKITSGFSLTEVIITVAIISTIASFAVPAYFEYIVRTKVSSILPVLEDMKIRTGSSYGKHGIFPALSTTAISNHDVITESAFETTTGTPTFCNNTNTCIVAGDIGCVRVKIKKEVLETASDGYLFMVAAITDGIMSWRCQTDKNSSINAAYLPSGCTYCS
jgi:type IV pilus assembly protein PilA